MPKTNKPLNDDLLKEYFDSALGEYELELENLAYDEVLETLTIDDDKLIRTVILLLAKIMYKYYLNQSLDEVMKILNIVGKDISVTGADGSKKTLEHKITNLDEEISSIFTKLKKNSYSTNE
jgi:hypothetical protein